MYSDENIEIPYDAIHTLEEAELLAAKLGISITKPMRRQMADIEMAIEEPKSSKRESVLDWVNRRTPQILQGIEATSAVLFTLTRAVILSFGVPLLLILLLIVEQQRVQHGIALFETTESLAWSGSWAMVILNLLLEFVIEFVESQQGYQSSKHAQFSMRIWWQQLAYFVGWTQNWQPHHVSPASRYKGLLRMVTFTILTLALAGSMRSVINQSDAAWYLAIQDIVVQSNLSLILTWVVGLLFAAASVLAAQGISRYIAVRCVEIIAQMNEAATAPSEVEALREKALVQFLLATISDRVAKKNSIHQSKREGD